MKDYYKIMDVPYDATQAEIRIAYHQQAKKFHPDVNPENASASHRFIEIQEAYFVLSDEDRRQQFHVKSKYPFVTKTKTVEETPDTILKKAKKLNQLLKEIDIFRMNRSLFSQAIHLLLSERNILILNRAGNTTINRIVVEDILQLCRVVSYKESIKISNKLLMIAGNDEALHKAIYQFTNRKRLRNFWDRYNLLIISFITLIICLFILIISN